MAKKSTKKDISVIRHYDHEDEEAFEIAIGDDELIAEISAHIETHIGSISHVIHQMISSHVHIDIHVVPPSLQRDFYTLITSGMSEKPMIINTDDGKIEIYAELMISLPPDWKIKEKDWEDTNNYWPIAWLYKLAHFPHAYATYFLEGHSIPNNDPSEPLASNTDFMGFIIGFPKLVPEEFIYLKTEKRFIIFFALYPVYNDEMLYKLEEGSERFFELAQKENLTELVELGRQSVVPRKGILRKCLKSQRRQFGRSLTEPQKPKP